MKVAVPLLVAAALLLLPRPAAAWLREGHMATGAIAFDAMEARDPVAVAAVVRVMAAHPDGAWFAPQLAGLAGRLRARRLFELMAVWPDAARGGPWDHDDWHYSQVIASSLRHLVPFAFGGAEDAFRANLRIARDAAAGDAARAVALCWVMHIVGDMHQPLHAAVWIGWRFPLSDAGGNWAWVRRAEGARAERLHFFWDAAGRDTGMGRDSPDGFVAALERRRPFVPVTGDPVAAFEGWIARTRALAYEVAYQRGALRPGVSAADAVLLAPDYVDQVRAVGADQIGDAGNRIGALLLGVR